MKKRVMVVFGTRPEAIKMCPVVQELRTRNSIETYVCISGQHKEMLKQVLDAFHIAPDYDLAIMKPHQTLFDITINILGKIRGILEQVHPDVVLVHGDTSTAFAVALACYYMRIPVGHVEAGLRTHNIYAPYPEEFNRQAIGLIAKMHFAPTERCKENLLKEGKDPSSIYVTGNTVVDALKVTVREDYTHEYLRWASDSRLILLTAHRRENLGKPLFGMLSAVRRIVEEFPDVKVIYPVHMNPDVREVAEQVLGDCERIRLIDPLPVVDFHNFLARSYLMLTDSGGIQEEASSLGKPALVMREVTERPEGVQAGTLKLVGTSERVIYDAVKSLLESESQYAKMCHASNPYGDGYASKRIADILEYGWSKEDVVRSSL